MQGYLRRRNQGGKAGRPDRGPARHLTGLAGHDPSFGRERLRELADAYLAARA